jgi:SPP1 gp7 family putative phage head morphogenesis protein
VETAAERAKRRRLEKSAENHWRKVHNASRSYGAALRQYVRQISAIVGHYADINTGLVPPDQMPALNEALRRYRDAIDPWARATAGRMIAEANRRNLTAWTKHARQMSREMHRQLAFAPIGEETRALMETQVGLIKSLPLDAAQRVHETTLAALETGQRYAARTPEIEEALARAHPAATHKWLTNRATLIARTETARTASVLVQARAEHIGVTHYQWQAVMDARTRESHARLDGRVFAWDDPPLSDPPDHHSHPGQIWNCRCVAMPILPSDIP